MKTSLVVTVLNEEKTINSLILSILSQTKKPDEVIIVDGGSSDRTVAKIQNAKFKMQNDSSKFKIIKKRGNRAMGRNEGIRYATGKIIAISDAGCTLDKNWIKNIVEPFSDLKVDVVAGYYGAKPETIFQKCLVPYVLVMPDRVDPLSFLPASRSMAFRKKVWKQIGGFNEQYSHNEDYVFARKLKKENIKIFFQKNAIVFWIPRKNFKEAFVMFYRFAFGDIEAGILRPKVATIFLRYFVVLVILLFSLFNMFSVFLICLPLGGYILWSIVKNYKHVNNLQAVFYLPILQITSDIAVITGTLQGLYKRFTSV